MQLNIQDKFNKTLPADPNQANTRRQVFKACFSSVIPKVPSNPKLIHASTETANLLGLSEQDINSQAFLEVFSGKKVLENTHPYAMCYGGHQFGHWAGQLGDGRAINLTEVEHQGKSWTLQLKGAGETPYSRRADGLAVLRSSVREHLCSEAMYHLGVPTTRSLSLALSGDQVMRDVLYDGNPAYEKGAIVCRVAPSFIRFGNFEIFSSRGDVETLRKLTDFTIKHFFPGVPVGTKEGYLEFFRQVTKRTMDMVIHWQRVGFVHGVMNTDNMSILGLTIDYGPYGWLEGFDPNWTPNTTDSQNRRYRYGNQPNISLWNLLQLANAIYQLIDETEPLQEILEAFQTEYPPAHQQMMNQKLGLANVEESDGQLVQDLIKVLTLSETDMTIFFRQLAGFSKAADLQHNQNWLTLIEEAFYQLEEIKGDVLDQWRNWFVQYKERLNRETQSDADRKTAMNKSNPKYVLRNYMAQLAIDAADKGDYSMIEELYELLKEPYSEQPEMEKWFAKRPEWARNKVGCSMLSCSS
ncbi:MAG: YdiU family protein [Saprospiraceae bacterium]